MPLGTETLSVKNNNTNADSPTPQIIIPSNLLHIINNLTEDYEQDEIYQIKTPNKNNPKNKIVLMRGSSYYVC